ncbi:MAG: hypothetical protein FWF85_10930, partial [Clostridiales bacterium]|nr:hypothetical protein [Clostridiales bacterium]
MKKTSKIAVMVLVLALTLFAGVSAVFAVTACPEPYLFTQPDGTIIVLTNFGDEHLDWVEDVNGNLVIFEPEENAFYYAVWTDEGAAPTGELVGVGFAGIAPLPRAQGHSIPQSVIEEAEQRRVEELDPITELAGEISIDFAAVPGTPPVVVPIELMTRKMLMVHVTWEDRSNLYISASNPTVLMPKLTGKQIYDLNFGLRQEVARSVNGYFQEMMLADDAVILPAEVLKPLDGYQGVIEVVLEGQNPNPRNSGTRGTILQQAITKACADGHVNLAAFDTDGNGNLATAELAIGFIIDGWESAIGSNSPSFWGMSTSGTPAASATNGVKIASFFGQGAYHRRTGNIPNDMLTTGIIAHEMGHSGYSYQDTYDYGTLTGSNTHTGQGYWSLQTQGSWARKTGENSGATPGYQDAYNLVRSGHVIPGVLANGEKALMNTHLDIYIAQTPITTPEPAAPATHPYGTRYGGQYFLLQQRKFGTVDNYDQGAFGSISSAANVNTGGILIFHNDMSVNITRINDKPTHKRSAIEEAHGVFMSMAQRSGMIEPGANRNNGDLNDLWGNTKREFNQLSDPGSGTYSAFTNNLTPPTQTGISGVSFSEITWNNADKTTSFIMGGLDVHKPTFNVAVVPAPAGANVAVTYRIENNDFGFTTLDLELPYNGGIFKPVALNPVAAGTMLDGGMLIVNPAFGGEDIIKVTYASPSRVLGGDLVFTITYAVGPAAYGDIPLEVDVKKVSVSRYGDLFEDVDLQIDPGLLVVGIMGDITGDGLITPEDAIELLQMYVGLIPWTPRALFYG